MFDKEGHGFIPVPDLTEVLTLLGELHRRVGIFVWLGRTLVRLTQHSHFPKKPKKTLLTVFSFYSFFILQVRLYVQVLQKLGEKLSPDECQV